MMLFIIFASIVWLALFTYRVVPLLFRLKSKSNYSTFKGYDD